MVAVLGLISLLLWVAFFAALWAFFGWDLALMGAKLATLAALAWAALMALLLAVRIWGE